MGSHSLLQGDLPNPEIKPRSPALQADSLLSEPPEKPIHWSLVEVLICISLLIIFYVAFSHSFVFCGIILLKLINFFDSFTTRQIILL